MVRDTHDIALESYQPSSLPDFDVFGAVVDVTTTSLEAHTEEL